MKCNIIYMSIGIILTIILKTHKAWHTWQNNLRSSTLLAMTWPLWTTYATLYTIRNYIKGRTS